MPAIERSLVSDQVFRQLLDGVLSGRYEPGELLPTQRRLAADMGVNMASIREAVKRLEQLRLVEVRQGEGMRVRDWRAHGSLDVIAPILFRASGLHRGTLESLLEARRLMLTEAARLAASRRTEEQAERLGALAERLGEASDRHSAQLLDFAFFTEMVEAADNVVFVLVMNSIRRLYLERAELFRGVVADHGKLVRRYRSAADAIAARDAGRAARATARLASAQEVGIRESLP